MEPGSPDHQHSQHVLRWASLQGENQLYCYEAAPQQPALSPGKPYPTPSPMPHARHCPHPPLARPDPPLAAVSPPVTQCLLESVLRGAALVPRRALAVMGCEVLRVLQLSNTAIVPISYHVPRKVSGPGGGTGRAWGGGP